ncbi:SDR family NAD(P)-dependent oxidoreductase [Aeoliella mucimassa]|nr:SDR family oxidoreductase [Aeoliella mucimassa]
MAGRSAVVTGSASGIGRAIALAFAYSGADVHLHTRANRAGLAELREQMTSLGVGGSDFVGDLADSSTCQALVAQTCGSGAVDLWVNNAGVDVLTGPAADWSFDRKLEALWQVDVRATMELSRAVGERMLACGQGNIINIGWDQAEFGMEGDSGQMFAAVKAAVMAFTRSLARSLAPTVRVNCLAPGWIATKWSGNASDYWNRRAQGEALLGRWGTPEDVAAAALFLASEQSQFITGHTLPVNGGFAGPYQGEA